MTAFWHLYAFGNWYDVAAEQLHCLARVRFPGPVRAHLTGSEVDAFELRALAGRFGVPVQVTRHPENRFEYPTLAALKAHCDRAGPGEKVLYFHTKNVTGKGLYYTKWRWAMMASVVVPWRERVAELDRYDTIGFCRKGNEMYAGNFWWARAAWVRRLPAPVASPDRFCYETWLFSAPGMNGLSLICDDGDPHLGGFYPKHGNPHERYIEFLVSPALAVREPFGGPDPGEGGV